MNNFELVLSAAACENVLVRINFDIFPSNVNDSYLKPILLIDNKTDLRFLLFHEDYIDLFPVFAECVGDIMVSHNI